MTKTPHSKGERGLAVVSSKEAADDLQSVLDEIKEMAEELAEGEWRERSQREDRIETAQLSLLVSAVERLAPPTTQAYGKALEGNWSENRQQRIKRLHGVVVALQKDYASGRLRGYDAIVRGEVFRDLLDAAERIVADGQHGKDAAANLAGPVLENHLRKLGPKHGIDLKQSDGSPKTGGPLNDDLAKAKAITKIDQKSVTAWLGIRNAAAHGDFGQYEVKQVELMIDGIRGFIERYPA